MAGAVKFQVKDALLGRLTLRGYAALSRLLAEIYPPTLQNVSCAIVRAEPAQEQPLTNAPAAFPSSDSD